MIRRAKSAVSTLTLCLTIAAVFSHAAFAADGGSDVGGGSDGCGSYWNTCNGASWRYYTTTEDSVFIKSGNGTPCYVDANGNITSGPKCTAPGGYITGCATVGGYWRYAWEGVAPVAGQHVGLIPIGGGGNPSYRSAMLFGGANAYWPETHGADVSSTDQKAAKIASGASGFTGSWEFVNQEYIDAINRRDTPNVGTWDPDSPLAWFCSAPTTNGGEFSSRSNVRIGNGAGYETSNWVDKATGNAIGAAGSGATVSITFSHDMKYSGTLPNDSVQIKKDWTYQLGVTGATVQMTPSSAISPTTGKNPYAPANNDAQQVWQSHSYSVTMPTVATGTQSDPVTICERITYQNKKLDGTTWTGGESYSRACATITVSATPPDPGVVSACALPVPAGYMSDENEGVSKGLSAAQNMTKAEGTWKQKDDIVWAKPGDSVQFMHCYFPGAQSATVSSSHGAHGTHNGTSNGAKTKIIATRNDCSIAASPSNYFFGASSANCGGRVGDATEKITYSPSNNNNRYSCAVGPGFMPFVSGGYQIPDFTVKPGNCGALANSDVGKTIRQDMTYGGTLHTKAKNEGRHYWTHTDSYDCGTDEEPDTCYDTHGVTHTNDYWSTEINQTGTEKTYAQVKIPYNYKTTTQVKTINKPEIYPGGDLPTQVTISIDPRSNPGVSEGGDYSTISKKSIYEVIVFTVDPGRSSGSIEHGGNEKTWGSGTNLCNVARGNICRSVMRQEKIFNGEGSLTGNSPTDKLVFDGSLAIPDAEVGTKFCVAAGVWPSDSHNTPNGQANTDGGGVAMNEGGAHWNYSEPNCRTISKKPTVQFHSAGVYSTGGITTSQTKKTAGYSINSRSGSGLYSGSVSYSNGSVSDTTGTRRVFGSFSEYEAITSGNNKLIDGFASGAGFGYGRNNSGNLSTTIGASAALPGGYPNVSFAPGVEANVCTYSTQSFNNDRCKDKVVGASTINSFGSTILERLLSRYTDTSIDYTLAPGSTINFSQNNYRTLDNGTKYIKVRGNASMNNYCMPKSTNAAVNNTIVVDVSGTLDINGNIQYGTNCNDNETYTSIAELPQMIIIAGDIRVASNVVRIDSWLVVGQNNNGSGSGNINTCASAGSQIIGSQIGHGYTLPKGDAGGIPCSNPLTVNGPVYAKKLTLNRNYGAGSNYQSILAAEIFNLRPDAYLWAYNQASRYSQAVTTYQQELAPRY